MYSWETFYIYCQQDARWFEPLERRTPTAEHLTAYRELIGDGWRLRRRGLWFVADPPGREAPPLQGWKLHVSVRSVDSVPALRQAIPVLRDAQVAFKFLMDPWSVAFTNGKLWPRGSSGKFMAAYPAHEDEFRDIARRLSAALKEFTGPYILSDRRCPTSTAVYYRYGGFTGISRIRADGATTLMIIAPDGSLYPDLRPPYWATPPWISTDPFGLTAIDASDGSSEPSLLCGQFRVDSAVQFSNRGGVYRATEVSTGRSLIIKEARPHVGFGDNHVECVDVLRREYRLLTTLSGTGHFVAPVALFDEWEHTFLVEEHISGAQLSQISIAENPLYTLELTAEALAAYHGRMCDRFSQLARAIAAAHRTGVVLGDLSWTNVLVDEASGKVKIIDIEGAVETGVDEHIGLFTKGVSSPRFVATGVCTPADDFYALGAMIFGSVMLANNFVGYLPAVLPRVLTEVARDLGVPADLTGLIDELTAAGDHEADDQTWDGEVVAKRLATLTVGEVSAWPPVIPLSRPAAQMLTGRRLAVLRRRIDDTIDGIVRYLTATASPDRSDRLFPADLGVFETNPLNVAFGASGVLHAVHQLTGEVPQRWLAWLMAQDVRAEECPPGLYLGISGVAWVLADLGQVGYASSLLRTAARHPLVCDQPDVLRGAAGHGLAALRLWQVDRDDEFLDLAARMGDHLATAAQRDERGACWPVAPDPLASWETKVQIPLGYAHGPAGIALFLLYLSCVTGDHSQLALGRAALDFELNHAQRLNDRVTAFPALVDDTAPVLRDYWDQGTAGVLTTLVRYLARTGDDDLRPWLGRLLPDVCRKYAVSPQLFHGLAGLGNAVLDVAEFTEDESLFAEARRVAEGVLLFRIDTPDGVTFPGEQALRESADFATGAAGVGLFLHRLRCAAPGARTNTNFVLDDLLTSAPVSAAQP